MRDHFGDLKIRKALRMFLSEFDSSDLVAFLVKTKIISGSIRQVFGGINLLRENL